MQARIRNCPGPVREAKRNTPPNLKNVHRKRKLRHYHSVGRDVVELCFEIDARIVMVKAGYSPD
jgi:hypothetical protein